MLPWARTLWRHLLSHFWTVLDRWECRFRKFLWSIIRWSGRVCLDRAWGRFRSILSTLSIRLWASPCGSSHISVLKTIFFSCRELRSREVCRFAISLHMLIFHQDSKELLFLAFCFWTILRSIFLLRCSRMFQSRVCVCLLCTPRTFLPWKILSHTQVRCLFFLMKSMNLDFIFCKAFRDLSDWDYIFWVIAVKDWCSLSFISRALFWYANWTEWKGWDLPEMKSWSVIIFLKRTVMIDLCRLHRELCCQFMLREDRCDHR